MKELDSICIIDDDSIYTLLLKRTLSKLNIANNVISYPNGKVALDALIEKVKAGEKVPEVIFLDINMPVLDGWSFLEEFADYKNNLRDTDIYIVSSSIAEEDKRKAHTFKEIKDYLVKPLESDTILKIVSSRDNNSQV